MRTKEHLRDKAPPRREKIGAPWQPQSPSTERIVFNEDKLAIWAWPSRGGVIVLEGVTALDFQFLGLNAKDPPMRRDHNQDAEDALCQRLLLLGARWFDSDQRRGFVANVADDNPPELDDILHGRQPAPSIMERTWVRVAFPDEKGPEGGCWVLEYDTGMYGYAALTRSRERVVKERVPSNAALVQLAKDMSEKSDIMENMGARFYASLEDYDGSACLNAWKEKTHGEFGPLVQTTPTW